MSAVPADRRFSPAALLTAGLAALPALALAVLVGRYWFNLPVSDEWGSLGGVTLAKAREHTLSLFYLFSQHTESRPVFPRLAALALNAGGGGGEWDVRRGMAFNLVVAAGISALLWRALDRGRPAWSRFLILAAMNALLFSPVGWEIWLLGQGYLVLLTLLCLAGTLAVNASDMSLRAKAGLNAILAFVGTFSFSNGLLLWPLGWPVRSEGRAEEDGWRPRALYAAAAGASLALFFIGFRPTDRAAVPFALGHPLAAARFFLTWCAVPLRPVGEPDAGHLLLGAAIIGLFAVGAGRAWRVDRRRAWPWLVLGTFALVSGLLAAAGRAGGGLEFALSSRYAITAALLPVAALGAWWTAGLRNWHTGLSAGLTGVLGVAAMLYGPAFGASVEEMRGAREAREKAREALAFIDLMPDNPQLRPIYSDLARDPGALRVAFHRLQAVGLVRVPGSPPALEDALGKPLPVKDPRGVGSFDVCTPRGAGQLVVSGWSSDPAAPGERPAPLVIFQWTPLDAAGNPAGRPRPWTMLRVDRDRPDVAQALGRPELARCGFSEAIYRPLTGDGNGAGRVEAWAVEPASGQARALDHTFDVPPAR